MTQSMPEYLTSKPASWDEESLSDDDLVSRAFDLGMAYAEAHLAATAERQDEWGVEYHRDSHPSTLQVADQDRALSIAGDPELDYAPKVVTRMALTTRTPWREASPTPTEGAS